MRGQMRVSRSAPDRRCNDVLFNEIMKLFVLLVSDNGGINVSVSSHG